MVQEKLLSPAAKNSEINLTKGQLLNKATK